MTNVDDNHDVSIIAGSTALASWHQTDVNVTVVVVLVSWNKWGCQLISAYRILMCDLCKLQELCCHHCCAMPLASLWCWLKQKRLLTQYQPIWFQCVTHVDNWCDINIIASTSVNGIASLLVSPSWFHCQCFWNKRGWELILTYPVCMCDLCSKW